MAVTSTVQIPPPSGIAVAFTDAAKFDDGATWTDRQAQGLEVRGFTEPQRKPIDDVLA